ncbi:MAG: hypothetical protein RLZZ42_292 [Bacteroidota bacterium]|jgi:predicted nucleotidyltransferase
MKGLVTIKQTLKELKPELVKNFHVSSIDVLGSIVRNDFSENSDVDIMVDFSRPIGIEFIDLADLLEEKFHQQVDLVSKKGIKPQYFSKTLRT